ncbi:MAG: ABC transporter ATP-binding protein, partial [Shewanella sp.]
MFKFFESLTQPLPPEEPTQPPKTLYAFCRHYTRGFGKPLIVMSILTATLAILEVSLFGFMGKLVDWLVTKNPQTLWQDEHVTLISMSVIVLIVIPLIVWLHASIVHQTLLGNYPMAIRWQAHRYLLKQSIGFYQDDFAGRVATKVMQTSLAVRETVMKLLDVLMYILIYFTSM